MDRGAWHVTIHGVAKSQTRLKWFSTYARVREKNSKNYIRIKQSHCCNLKLTQYFKSTSLQFLKSWQSRGFFCFVLVEGVRSGVKINQTAADLTCSPVYSKNLPKYAQDPSVLWKGLREIFNLDKTLRDIIFGHFKLLHKLSCISYLIDHREQDNWLYYTLFLLKKENLHMLYTTVLINILKNISESQTNLICHSDGEAIKNKLLITNTKFRKRPNEVPEHSRKGKQQDNQNPTWI